MRRVPRPATPANPHRPCHIGINASGIAASCTLSLAHPPCHAHQPPPATCRLAHVAHALACTALVAATLTQRGGAFQAPVATPTVLYAVTPLSTATLCFSLGYFLADITIMLCTVSQAPMLAHHLGGLAALLATLTTGECHFYGLLLLSTEVTTPFICARWYLHKAGRRKTQLFLINGICIVAGWVLSRILLFVYIFSHMWEHRREMARLSLRVQVR